MKKYEQIDISGDVSLRVWGNNLEELFENAAEGTFNLITDASIIKETEEKKIILSSDNNENLLIQWLNELIFLFDTYGFIGKRFNVHILDTSLRGGRCDRRSNLMNALKKKRLPRPTDTIKLHAEVSCGIFDPEVNESRLLIKAATYHELSIKKTNSRWEATVIFDI